MVKQILKEELLAIKINQGILKEHKRLVSERSDWYSLVAEEYMKLERGEDFDSSVIEEGVWSKIKSYMAKLPNLEKGGKIFGRTKRTKAAADKLEAAIANAAKKGFGNFRKRIEADYPEFPNMESKEEFMNALLDIGAVYDSLDAVVGKGIDAVSANAVVDALREYVSFLLDYELSDTYKHFNEGQDPEEELEEAVSAVTPTAAPARRTPNRTGTAGGGGAPEDPGTPKGKFTKRGAQGVAVDSTALAGLDSNKLPAILGLSGAAATLAALLLKSGWALSLLTKAKAGGAVAKGPISTITTKLAPKAGEGFTQMLGRIAQGNPGHFGPKLPPADLFKAMKSLGINPTNPTELFSLGVDPAAYKAAIGGGATTIGDMFPASNKKLFLSKGASAVATLTKALGAATGGAAVAAGQLAAASTLASTLGIGLVAAGAAVKLIRIKGQKSSRAQLLSDLGKELQPFDVPDSQQAIEPPVDVTPAPTPEAGTEAGGKFPIVITRKEITDLIQKQSSEKLEKMLKQAGIDGYSGDKLKRMIAKQNLLPLFDEYLNDSDVGDYFRLEGRGEVKEQIDIKKVFGARSGRETQILTFAFGVFLRAYIAKETKKLLNQGIEIPEEKLTQLNKAVINLSRKSLQNALKSSTKKPSPAKKPSAAKKPDALNQYRGRQSQPLDYESIDEGIDRKDQVIIERWQRISGINKKET
tara:strand:- start:33 stop:2129 length:2097 start_codon:yes stop_codon:yes gene_type:complete